MINKFLLLLVIALFTVLSVSAQFDNSYLYNRIRPADSLSKELHFNFYNFNYVRNYEYSNNFHDGYTLFGTQLQPQLTYYANPNLAVTAGAYFRKDFGNEKGLEDTKPLFNVTYHKKDLSFIFGSLEGNIAHDYIEPIYDFERKITTPIEYGTQLLVEKPKFKLDTWVSWQKMIYKGDAAKEEIAGGLITQITLLEDKDWKIAIPVQFLAYHQGGQIDILKEIPISTLFNGAAGLKIEKKLGYNVKEVFMHNYLAVYKDFSPEKRRAYQGGFGLWLNLGANTRWGTLMASYWKGNDFITIKGMPLYQSVSENLYEYGYTRNQRNIVAIRYAYQHELLPHLYLDIRLEPHFDLNEKANNLQFNHSLFLTYKQDFKILKIKN